MPPPPIAGAAFSSLGLSTTIASVVVIREETLQSRWKKTGVMAQKNNEYSISTIAILQHLGSQTEAKRASRY
jgi:hypothetical protein